MCYVQIQERPEETEAASSEDNSSLESHGRYRLGLSYGRLVSRMRWFIIAFWVVIVLLSVPFAAQIGSVLTGGGYTSTNSESARAATVIQEKLHPPLTQLLIIFQSEHTAVSAPAYRKEVNHFMNPGHSFSH